MFGFFDVMALSWFLFLWVGYTKLATMEGKKRKSLASVMHDYRKDWMKRMLMREQRISDMSAVANLERNAAFFASTCILIIAGLITVLAASDQAISFMNSIEFVQAPVKKEWDMKLIIMVGIFVYAFFTFTWCMRQYGFCSVLIGSAPLPREHEDEADLDRFAEHSAGVLDQAGRHFNLGLRAFYFSLAMLVWFVNTFWFMLASSLIVMVLYRREFLSKTLTELVKAKGLESEELDG